MQIKQSRQRLKDFQQAVHDLAEMPDHLKAQRKDDDSLQQIDNMLRRRREAFGG